MTKITTTLLIILLSAMSVSAIAQSKSTGTTWTNRVSRLVYIGDTLTKSNKDTTLAELLTKMVVAQKLVGYSTFDSKLETPVNPVQLNEKIHSVDSIEVEDPVTGAKYIKVIEYNINYATEVRYFRILEEWTFDADNATSHIQIVGIAPVKEIFDNNHNFRGRMSLYWLKYADAKDAVEKYCNVHPVQSLFKSVFDSY